MVAKIFALRKGGLKQGEKSEILARRRGKERERERPQEAKAIAFLIKAFPKDFPHPEFFHITFKKSE
jgi:hypothetical protein